MFKTFSVSLSRAERLVPRSKHTKKSRQALQHLEDMTFSDAEKPIVTRLLKLLRPALLPLRDP